MDFSSLWDFSDPAASETRFREAASAAQSDADHAIALTHAARALGLQGRFDDAHALLDGIAAPEGEPKARVELERGRLLRSAGGSDVARTHFAAAAALAGASSLEDLEIDALHMVALTLDGPEQREATQAALVRARAASTPEGRAWEAPLLNNLGMAHADAGDWPTALGAFEQAVELRRLKGDEEATHIARWMVAWALRNLGRVDEALILQRELKAGLDSRGATDEYVDQEIALLEAKLHS